MQCTFADTSVCFCYARHLPSHHIKEAAKGSSRLQQPPPFVDSFIWWLGKWQA